MADKGIQKGPEIDEIKALRKDLKYKLCYLAVNSDTSLFGLYVVRLVRENSMTLKSYLINWIKRNSVPFDYLDWLKSLDIIQDGLAYCTVLDD